MTSDLPGEILPGPDPRRPDVIFRDGGGAGCVEVLPVVAPTWGRSGVGLAGSVLMVALMLTREVLWRLRGDRDDRFKVVVSRSRRRFPVWFRTVAIEFYETEEAADARQVEILGSWAIGRYDRRPAISPRERRRLRLGGAAAG